MSSDSLKFFKLLLTKKVFFTKIYPIVEQNQGEKKSLECGVPFAFQKNWAPSLYCGK